MREVVKCREDIQSTVKNVEIKQAEWVKINEENEQSLLQIMEQQKKEKEEIEKKIVSVIKEKKKMVRDTVEKVKCVFEKMALCFEKRYLFQSVSSGGNMHELVTAGRARTVFRKPCFYIHLHIHICGSLALRHVVCLYVHLTERRLFYTTIVRSSRPLGNRKSGRVVRT